MATVKTKIGTEESARKLRVEPTGGITATNVQKALEATVSSARTISTTAPLAGGGDLSADRTLSITGVAGRVLAGATPAFTATPTLGASGTFGSVTFGNATSGLLTLQAVTGALGAVTVSMPAATDTLVGKATADTFTNKTFDTAGAGNSLLINGLAATANTGTGAVVRTTSPALVTPLLGTPTSGVLTTCTGLPLTTGVTGTLGVGNGGTGGSVASGTLLDNITGFGATGLLVRAGAGNYQARSVAGGTGITVTNGDGVSANPSVAITSTISAGGPTGAATTVPVLTWNAQGQLTAVTTAATGVTTVGTATVGQIPGVTSNTAATAGNVGQLITNHVVSSTSALTSGVAVSPCSISLTAGDWDVWGEVATAGNAATTVSNVIASIGTTINTLDVSDETRYNTGLYFGLTVYNAASYGVTSVQVPVGATQMLLNATTTVYLTVSSVFATSTSTGGGTIYARRRR